MVNWWRVPCSFYLGRCVLYDSMWSVLLVGMVAVCHACADPSQVSSGKLTTLSYAGK